MKCNVGITDRFVRLLLASAIVMLHYTNNISGIMASVTITTAFILIATVIIGICPIYKLLHIDTDSEESHSH